MLFCKGLTYTFEINSTIVIFLNKNTFFNFQLIIDTNKVFMKIFSFLLIWLVNKYKLYFSITLMLIGVQIQLQAQVRPMDNLCYSETLSERISVAEGVDLSTLDILDKLKFKEKEYKNDHSEYFNEAGYATHDVNYVSQSNMFPKWYLPPSTVRSDESGMKSFFTETSKYLKDGWTGGSVTKSPRGKYIEDLKTGEKYLYQPYSEMAEKYYALWNKSVQEKGFLYKYVFSFPDTEELTILESEGFEITFLENIIRAKNASTILLWDTSNKIFVKQSHEGESLKNTTKTYYAYNQEFQAYLIKSVVTTIPEHFDNGDCYETITRRVYSDYTGNCTQNSIPLRGMVQSNDVQTPHDISIHPNPASHQIMVDVPLSNLPSSVSILDVTGSMMMQRKLEKDISNFNLSVGDLPSGIYVLRVQQGEQQYSSKFVKQ